MFRAKLKAESATEEKTATDAAHGDSAHEGPGGASVTGTRTSLHVFLYKWLEDKYVARGTVLLVRRRSQAATRSTCAIAIMGRSQRCKTLRRPAADDAASFGSPRCGPPCLVELGLRCSFQKRREDQWCVADVRVQVAHGMLSAVERFSAESAVVRLFGHVLSGKADDATWRYTMHWRRIAAAAGLESSTGFREWVAALYPGMKDDEVSSCASTDNAWRRTECAPVLRAMNASGAASNLLALSPPKGFARASLLLSVLGDPQSALLTGIQKLERCSAGLPAVVADAACRARRSWRAWRRSTPPPRLTRRAPLPSTSSQRACSPRTSQCPPLRPALRLPCSLAKQRCFGAGAGPSGSPCGAPAALFWRLCGCSLPSVAAGC